MSEAAIVEDRIIQPDAPGDESSSGKQEARLEHAYWSMGLLDAYKAQKPINEYTALTYSAIWGCVRVISQTIASLGWHTYETGPNGRGKNPVEDDVTWILSTQPNPEVNAFSYWECLLKDALTFGNGYGEIERDPYGRPRWQWRIAPDRVTADRLGGELVYVVENGRNEKPTILSANNVYHLKGMTSDGIVGYSVIQMAKQTISLGMKQEDFGDQFFGNGPLPGGLLKLPGNVKKAERDDMQLGFQKAYGGSKNAGKVVVVSGGAEFTPLSLPNSDAQWIEGRRFSVEEVCRWYGVPPHKLADLTRSTNNNIEHQAIEFVQDCIMPWCRRLESEADIKLYGRKNRGRKWTKLNIAALLRGDSRTQTENLSRQVTSGMRTVNEAREELDLNPVEYGDTPLIQGAMIPLERAMQEPEPAIAQPAKSDSQQSDDDGAQQDGAQEEKTTNKAAMPQEHFSSVKSVFTALLQDAFSRILRVEEDKAKRATNKGNLKAWVTEYFTEEHRQFIADAITPILEGAILAQHGDRSKAKQAAMVIAKAHHNFVVDTNPSFDNWQSLANHRATQAMQLIEENHAA